jgi:hypothetical protein
LEKGDRTFEMLPRFEKFSGEPVGDALRAMRDASFSRIGSRLDVCEDSRRMRPHRR